MQLKTTLATVALLLVASVAHADPTKDQCLAADVRAQELRRAGKLHDALTQLEVCTNAACSESVRADCNERTDEITRVMPSVVFDVKTTSGEDVVDTRVEMDGKLLRERLDGRPVPVDPGEHTFVFTARGNSQTVHVLVQEGIVDRPVAVTIANDVVAPPPPPPLEHANEGNAQRAVGLALGGVGLFGIALGGSFGGVAIVEHDDVANACPNNVCPNDAVRASNESKNSESSAFATASTIAFIAGAVLFVTGIVVYVSAPHRARVGLGPGAIIGTF